MCLDREKVRRVIIFIKLSSTTLLILLTVIILSGDPWTILTIVLPSKLNVWGTFYGLCIITYVFSAQDKQGGGGVMPECIPFVIMMHITLT